MRVGMYMYMYICVDTLCLKCAGICTGLRFPAVWVSLIRQVWRLENVEAACQST